MRDLLKSNFEKAQKEYMDFLCDEFESQVKKLEHLVEKVKDRGDDVDIVFEDFNIRLVTDSSQSDYHNFITFLCVNREQVMVGNGVWDCDYDYSDFGTGDLPSEISEIESVLDDIIKEVALYEKNI